jgi:hypothetical protein
MYRESDLTSERPSMRGGQKLAPRHLKCGRGEPPLRAGNSQGAAALHYCRVTAERLDSSPTDPRYCQSGQGLGLTVPQCLAPEVAPKGGWFSMPFSATSLWTDPCLSEVVIEPWGAVLHDLDRCCAEKGLLEIKVVEFHD